MMALQSSCTKALFTGADWPSGEPGEFPVAWQPIWPAALHFFFIYNLLLLFYIVVVVVFVAY